MLPTKTLADFARIALEHQLVSIAAVRSWGDSLIESMDVATPWMIDIAFLKPKFASYVLARVPGTSEPAKSAALVCALLHRRWQQNSVGIQTVRRIGWKLHLEDLLETHHKENANGNWGVTLEVECEGLSEGWRSESEVRDFVREALSRYDLLLASLPKWVDIRDNNQPTGPDME